MHEVGRLDDPDHHIRIGLVTNRHHQAMLDGSVGSEVAVVTVIVLIQYHQKNPYRQRLAIEILWFSRLVISVLLHMAIIIKQTFIIADLISFNQCRIHIKATFNPKQQVSQREVEI